MYMRMDIFVTGREPAREGRSYVVGGNATSLYGGMCEPVCTGLCCVIGNEWTCDGVVRVLVICVGSVKCRGMFVLYNFEDVACGCCVLAGGSARDVGVCFGNFLYI